MDAAATGTSRCDNPDADQPVWSDPTYVSVGASISKPIVLSNGDWMLPVYVVGTVAYIGSVSALLSRARSDSRSECVRLLGPGNHLGLAWLRDLPRQRIQRTHGSRERRQRDLDAVPHQVRYRGKFFHRFRSHVERTEAFPASATGPRLRPKANAKASRSGAAQAGFTGRSGAAPLRAGSTFAACIPGACCWSSTVPRFTGEATGARISPPIFRITTVPLGAPDFCSMSGT